MNINIFIAIYISLSIFIFADLNRNKNTVIDNKRDLMWQDNLDAKTYNTNWVSAIKYCKNLTLNKYTNWRLPHIDELLSIVDKSRYNPAIYPAFKNVAPLYYWSISTYKPSEINAWGADFGSGNDGAYHKTHSIYVRCVRFR